MENTKSEKIGSFRLSKKSNCTNSNTTFAFLQTKIQQKSYSVFSENCSKACSDKQSLNMFFIYK